MNFFLNYSKLFTALLWLAFVSYLFCLPGTAIPKVDWMSSISFDKWVHIGIFGVLVFLWSRGLELVSRKSLFLLLILAVLYGLLIEVIQDQLIVNRSFDWGDLVAGFVGSLAGLWIWVWSIKK